MQTIGQSQAIEMLSGIRGAVAVTLVTSTEPKLRKGNPFAGIRKVSRVNGMINFIYENAVNNQRGREGLDTDFQAEPRKWGERIRREDGTITPLVEHKGKHYLELRIGQVFQSEFQVDGKPVPREDVKPWEYTKSESSRQEVEKQVILRDYAIESIREMSLGGELYVLK